jgi:CHAD domain-containing protein
MVDQYREREDKYDVVADWLLPDLTGALPPGARLEHAAVALRSKYFDTDDCALLSRGITLRLRSGDQDAGWQLKVPEDGARTELRLAPDAAARGVPREMRDLLLGVRGGATLKPVAVLDTARRIGRVVDSSGTVLAEIADDQVSAASGMPPHRQEWREVEVELVAGDEALLTAIGERLREAGATPSTSSSKLARVLNLAAPAKSDERPETLADLVAQYLSVQYEALLTGDLAIRRGRRAVHPTRVATRRYRSVLRIFADMFDAERAAALDAELAWYADLLGAVRDREVLRAHLARSVASLPPQLVIGPVAEHIDERLQADQSTAQHKLLRQMRGQRYLALLAELKTWHDKPPFNEEATAPAPSVKTYLHRSGRTFAKRLKKAGRADGSDELLHRARKAGKRTRYAAELASPVLGKPARRVVKRATKLQDLLGEQHDSIVASEVLLRLGEQQGQNTFTYGVLYTHEQDQARAIRERARTLTWSA